MYSKIRRLYDSSKFPIGSKLRKEADTIYHLAKKKLLLGISGAFAVGNNFVGKITDGRATLLQTTQTSCAYGVSIRMPQDPRTAYYYVIRKPAFSYPSLVVTDPDGTLYTVPENYTGARVKYPKTPVIYFAFKEYYFSGSLNYSPTVNTSTVTGEVVVKTRAFVEVHRGYVSFRKVGSDIRVDYNNAPKVAFIYDNANSRLSILDSQINSNTQTTIQLLTGTQTISFSGGLVSDGTTQSGVIDFPINTEYLIRLPIITQWNNHETARLAAYSDWLVQEDVYYNQLSDGEVINIGAKEDVYPNAYYPDDVLLYPPWWVREDYRISQAGYEEHLIRHRNWRKQQDEAIYVALSSGEMPKNIALSIMYGAPYSLCVGIGSLWDGYRISDEFTTPSSGVTRVTRTLYARAESGEEVIVLQGFCDREVISVYSAPEIRYHCTFVNFPALNPVGFTAYLNGNYNLSKYENLADGSQLPINPSRYDGMPIGVSMMNGTYDSLSSGIDMAEAETYSIYLGVIPPPDPINIRFDPIDLSALADSEGNIPPDVLRYDKDLNENGVIEPSEKSATSTRFWIGKGLSEGESIKLFPLCFVSLVGGEYVELGMFPAGYSGIYDANVNVLVAIRIYAYYHYTYAGDGGFSFVGSKATPTLDEEGEELFAYTEFPYSATLLPNADNSPIYTNSKSNRNINGIVVSSGTVYDDILSAKKAQNEGIKSQYEKDIEAGNITINGLYEWCIMQT